MTLVEFGDEMYLQYKDRLSEYGFDEDDEEENSDACDIGAENYLSNELTNEEQCQRIYDYFDAYCVPYGEL